MAIDPELLEILVCPKTKGELELVPLPEEVRRELVEKYREHFRDEEPVVEELSARVQVMKSVLLLVVSCALVVVEGDLPQSPHDRSKTTSL